MPYLPALRTVLLCLLKFSGHQYFFMLCFLCFLSVNAENSADREKKYICEKNDHYGIVQKALL